MSGQPVPMVTKPRFVRILNHPAATTTTELAAELVPLISTAPYQVIIPHQVPRDCI